MRTTRLVLILTCLLASPTQAAETITYTYDAQGRMVTVTHTGTVNNNVTATYSFDAADNRTNVTIVNAASRVIVVPLNGLTVIPIPDP
jgi:YD repeat-containing protein